jgi:hypothetical protein
LRFVEGEGIDDDLYALACEPDLRVRIFSACLVDGVRYHTVDRERNRRTQNSGVMVEGTHNNECIDFYGCLKEIIELQYNSDLMEHRTVVLFQCDWFDTHSKKVNMKCDGYFRSINHSSRWYKNDAFILAAQATKVFYLQDIKNAGSWKIVQKFTHRHLWSVAENDIDEIPSASGLSYQDDTCVGFEVQVNEGDTEMIEHQDADSSVNVSVSVVDEFWVQRQEEVQEDGTSDDEDETGWQYASDNEESTTLVNDNDDFSDNE